MLTSSKIAQIFLEEVGFNESFPKSQNDYIGSFHSFSFVLDELVKNAVKALPSREISEAFGSIDEFLKSELPPEERTRIVMELFERHMEFTEIDISYEINSTSIVAVRNNSGLNEDLGQRVEEGMNKIYVPFERYDTIDTHTRVRALIQGNGQGLPLARMFATRNNGSLHYKEDDNHTSIILNFTLPEDSTFSGMHRSYRSVAIKLLEQGTPPLVYFQDSN